MFFMFIVLSSYAVNIFESEIEKFWKPYMSIANAV